MKRLDDALGELDAADLFGDPVSDAEGAFAPESAGRKSTSSGGSSLVYIPVDEPGNDFWSFNGRLLVRHHNDFRDALFIPWQHMCLYLWSFLTVIDTLKRHAQHWQKIRSKTIGSMMFRAIAKFLAKARLALLFSKLFLVRLSKLGIT